MIHFSNISCGVHQLYELHRPPSAILKDVLLNDVWGFQSSGLESWTSFCYSNKTFDCKRAFFMFSDNTVRSYGIRFAECIKKEKLGYIIETEPRRNPNSGNDIIVWV